jgi:hypothetical protein
MSSEKRNANLKMKREVKLLSSQIPRNAIKLRVLFALSSGLREEEVMEERRGWRLVAKID